MTWDEGPPRQLRGDVVMARELNIGTVEFAQQKRVFLVQQRFGSLLLAAEADALTCASRRQSKPPSRSWLAIAEPGAVQPERQLGPSVGSPCPSGY